MAKLEKWFFVPENNYIRLSGLVYNHLRLRDGTFIDTTRILKIERNDMNLIVHTENTEYHMEINDYKFNEYATFTDEIEKFHLEKFSADLSYLYDLLIAIGKLKVLIYNTYKLEPLDLLRSKYYKHYSSYDIEKFENDFSYIFTLLYNQKQKELSKLNIKDNEMLLELNNERETLMDRALVKLNNQIIAIDFPIVHLGMFQDSVLLNTLGLDNLECNFDFRFFPQFNEITIYSWSPELESILFYNTCENPIKVSVELDSAIITVPPREMVRAFRKESWEPGLK